MSNSGWNDKACLAAAKELSQSFKKSGGKNAMHSAGRDRGNRSSSSSIPMKRQESFQHTPRPAPPPPGNHNISHGPIMKGSLDFLNRTDSTFQKPSDSVQAKATHVEGVAKQARNSTVLSTPASRSIATVQVNHESAAEEHNIPKPAPAPAIPEAPKAGSNVDLLRGLTTPEPTQCDVEANMVSSNMAETFFSLMSQDSDEESEDSLTTEAEDKAVNKSNTTKFLRYTSDDLLKLRANAKNDVLPPDSIVKRISTVGDTNTVRKINTPGKSNTIGNTGTMEKQTAMGNAIAMGKSKLAAAIGKASSHLTLPRQASSRCSTEVNPRVTPSQLAITEPYAVQASTKTEHRSGVTQNAIGKLEVPQIQVKPKPQTAVVQKVDDKSHHEVVQKVVDEAEVPQIRAKPQSQATTADAKSNIAMTQKKDDQATSQGETRGPSSGLFVIHPAPSLDQTPMQLGTFSADLPIREAESSNAAAHVAKPRKPTKGLTASMWAQ